MLARPEFQCSGDVLLAVHGRRAPYLTYFPDWANNSPRGASERMTSSVSEDVTLGIRDPADRRTRSERIF
jgi:hypothetical protein